MFHVHHDDFGKGRSWAFLKKRIVRIAPIYWILTTAALLVVLFVPGMFTKERSFDPLWVAGSYLFFPVAYAPSQDTPLLQVGWTLNYEAYFYAVLALALCLNRAKAVVAITALFAGSVVVGRLAGFSHPWAQLLTSGLLLEFLLGGFIALLQRAQGNKLRHLHLAGLLIGIGLLMASFSSGRHNDDMDRLVVWGLPAVLIVNGVCRLNGAATSPFGRAAVTLGDASYSIYLIQAFSLPVMAFALNRSGLFQSLPADICVVALVAWTAVAGWLTWRFIERPITRRLRRELDRRDPATTATAG